MMDFYWFIRLLSMD